MFTELRTVVLIVACSMLVGCAPRQAAQVIERTVITQAQKDEEIGGQLIRIVQLGDTLYSIAFVLGLDVNRVAAWNGIADTSKLRTGMRIRLTEPISFRYPADVSSKKLANKTLSGRDISRNNNRTKKLSNKKSSLPKATTNTSTGSVKPKPQIRHVVAGKSANTKSRASEYTETSSHSKGVVAQWLWPLRGTLISRFNLKKGQQGIDIQGQRGQSVKASASGEVVYAGDSLKGYGNLIIIKHSADYLSAYAHNQSITVHEGQQIEQGQEIAKLGRNLKGIAASQFQIRKNGNPVDPMSYLH